MDGLKSILILINIHTHLHGFVCVTPVRSLTRRPIMTQSRVLLRVPFKFEIMCIQSFKFSVGRLTHHHIRSESFHSVLVRGIPIAVCWTTSQKNLITVLNQKEGSHQRYIYSTLATSSSFQITTNLSTNEGVDSSSTGASS